MIQPLFDRFTGRVLFEAEIDADADTSEGVRLGLAVRVALKAGADLSRADLRGAYLRGAHLRGAHLRGADLGRADLGRSAWGDGAKWREGALVTREPIILSLPDLPYAIAILDRHVQLGCELHEIDAWAAMGEAEIAKMDGDRGVELWRRWRDPLLAVAKAAGRPLPAPSEKEAAA